MNGWGIGWDIAANLTNLVARLPVERLFTRDRTKDLDKFEERLKEKGLLHASKGIQAGSAIETNPSPPTQNPAQIGSQSPLEASQAPPAPTLQQIEKSSKGKECRPCTADHFATCAGILSEALRFARSDGMEGNEVQERLALCAQEMNAWERWDAAPGSFVELSDEDKDFLRRWLPKGRGFRHKVNEVESLEELEKTAADAQRLHLEARKELKARRQSPLAERFEAEMGEHFEEAS